MKPKLTFASVTALLALFIALGGSVYAAATISGKAIRKGSIPADRVKRDSLTGTQVNESTLAAVPATQRAEEAVRALEAETASSAISAEVAGSAGSAAEATRATRATEAERAKTVDRAGSATDGDRLGGLPPESYLRSGCAQQTIKAAVRVLPPTQFAALRIVDQFNCASNELPRVDVVRTGEYKVFFPNLPTGAPVAASMKDGVTAAVQPLPAEGAFRVTVFQTTFGEALAAGDFVLAVF